MINNHSNQISLINLIDFAILRTRISPTVTTKKLNIKVPLKSHYISPYFSFTKKFRVKAFSDEVLVYLQLHLKEINS